MLPLSEAEQCYQKLKHLDDDTKLKLIERLKKDIEEDLTNNFIVNSDKFNE